MEDQRAGSEEENRSQAWNIANETEVQYQLGLVHTETLFFKTPKLGTISKSVHPQ